MIKDKGHSVMGERGVGSLFGFKRRVIVFNMEREQASRCFRAVLSIGVGSWTPSWCGIRVPYALDRRYNTSGRRIVSRKCLRYMDASSPRKDLFGCQSVDYLIRPALPSDPCMRLEDIATYFRPVYSLSEVNVSSVSISRALKDARRSKKATQDIARDFP